MQRFTSTLLIALLVSACNSTHFSQPSTPVHYQADAHVTADLEVGGKIEGHAQTFQLLGWFEWGANRFADGVNFDTDSQRWMGLPLPSLDRFYTVKAAAAYDAVAEANADVIVAPRYVVEIDDYWLFAKTKATVSGYKGTIKRFKNTPAASTYRFEY